MQGRRHGRSVGALLSDDIDAFTLWRASGLYLRHGAVVLAILAAAHRQARLSPLLCEEYRRVGQAEDREQQDGKQSSHGNSLDQPRSVLPNAK